MQRNITEKLKISKSQKNNSIKLLAATIALSAGLTAMDEAAAILDDELGAKKASSKKSDVGAVKDSAHDKEDHDKKSVKYLKDEENLDEQSKKKDNVTDEETVKSVKQTQLAKLKEIKEDEDEVEEGFTVQNEKDVKIGDDASSLPPEDRPEVVNEFELEKDLQQVEEKKKKEVVVTEKIVDQLVEEENKGKIVVIEKESTAQGGDVEPSDDEILTLTGTEGEQVVPVRGTKPNERGSTINAILENDKGCVAASGSVPSATTEREQEQPPTVVGVIFGWGVFLGQSAIAAIDYATPNFVKSIYSKGEAFFTSIGDIIRFFRTKK